MPEGIVPELIVIVALVVLVGAVAVRVRRRPPPAEEVERAALRDAEGGPATTAPAREETTRQAGPAPTIGAPPVEERIRPSLRDRLTKSRKFLAGRLADALGQTADDETWEDVEAVLIQADIGVETATRIVGDLKGVAREHRAKTADELMGLLNQELVELFDPARERGLSFTDDGEPTVWLIVGVNGTGKTTTIGKLSHDLSTRGKSVALAAADTFRAAADEQLGVWGERTGAQVVRHQPGADPGAVAFDAFKYSKARGVDVLLVDTAGRLHTKTPLMDELAKVRRVIEKEGRVQESLLVIDATSGQNGLNQAREFARAAGVTGVVLTKLDGTAKGGIALAIERTLDIPIKLIGIGESVEDLEPFDPKAFVDALLS